MKILSSVLVLLFMGVAHGSQAIHFTSDDLSALIHLAQPERSVLEIDGLRGKFSPGPSLQYIGVQEQNFDLDLNVGGGLVDLRFNRFRTLTPTLKFLDGKGEIEFPIQDQEKVIKSNFGSISVKGVKLVAWIGFKNGTPELTWIDGRIDGQFKGTGLLKPKWVLDAVKKNALKTLKSQFELQLRRPEVVNAIDNGLKIWARFSKLPHTQVIVPGTLKVSAGINKPEISYEVE